MRPTHLTYKCAVLLLVPLAFCQHDGDFTKSDDIQMNTGVKMIEDFKKVTMAQTRKWQLVTASPSLRKKRQATGEDGLNAEFADAYNDSEDDGGGEEEGENDYIYGDDTEGGEVKETKHQRSKQLKKVTTNTPPPPSPRPPSSLKKVLSPPPLPVRDPTVNATVNMSVKPTRPNLLSKTNRTLKVPVKPVAARVMTTPRPQPQKRNMLPAAPEKLKKLKTSNISSINSRSKNHFIKLERNISRVTPTNHPPILTQPFKEMVITAGKMLRYIIAQDVFFDPEDATNLSLNMYQADNTELEKDSWIQFRPKTREIYGLPLETHIDRWMFILVAQDSEGQLVSTPIFVNVEKKKDDFTLNHRFILEFQLHQFYTKALDWQIRALQGVVHLYKDDRMDYLTVLSATESKDVCEIVWTNNTVIGISKCPINQVMTLWKVLSKDSGAPSLGLINEMKPELIVVRVRWEGLGECSVAVSAGPSEYPPEPRNQVGLLTAVAGHLFTYKIPADTFVDPEDGNTRSLALSLQYSDRSELQPNDWLQFNPINQEIYGLPTSGDVGSVKYQLTAEDSSKNRVYDNLVIRVVQPPPINPTAEFKLILDIPYEALAYDTKKKRRVVENLAALFGEKDTENIRIENITANPTTVHWYNTSLPTDRCPENQIDELKAAIEGFEETFYSDNDLKFTSLVIVPSGYCKVNTEEQSSKNAYDIPLPPINFAVHYFFYRDDAIAVNSLMTFALPAINILCIILITAVCASLMYKGRRVPMPDSYPRIRVFR